VEYCYLLIFIASSSPETFFAKTTNCFLESDWFPATRRKSIRIRASFHLKVYLIYGSEEIRMKRVGNGEPRREEARERVSGEPIKDDEDGKGWP